MVEVMGFKLMRILEMTFKWIWWVRKFLSWSLHIENYFQSDFSCKRHPRHSTRRRFSRCYNNATLVDIIFPIDDKRFLKVLTVCHNPKTEQTYYSQYQLTPANAAAHQRAIKRPSFIQADFFPEKDINLFYSRRHQREIISEFIIGSSDSADDSMFLSRGKIYCIVNSTKLILINPPTRFMDYHLGHLAAKGDFIYGNEQRATFYYINVMPQVRRYVKRIEWYEKFLCKILEFSGRND